MAIRDHVDDRFVVEPEAAVRARPLLRWGGLVSVLCGVWSVALGSVVAGAAGVGLGLLAVVAALELRVWELEAGNTDNSEVDDAAE